MDRQAGGSIWDYDHFLLVKALSVMCVAYIHLDLQVSRAELRRYLLQPSSATVDDNCPEFNPED